jgi:hypothetical protein
MKDAALDLNRVGEVGHSLQKAHTIPQRTYLRGQGKCEDPPQSYRDL